MKLDISDIFKDSPDLYAKILQQAGDFAIREVFCEYLTDAEGNVLSYPDIISYIESLIKNENEEDFPFYHLILEVDTSETSDLDWVLERLEYYYNHYLFLLKENVLLFKKYYHLIPR